MKNIKKLLRIILALLSCCILVCSTFEKVYAANSYIFPCSVDFKSLYEQNGSLGGRMYTTDGHETDKYVLIQNIVKTAVHESRYYVIVTFNPSDDDTSVTHYKYLVYYCDEPFGLSYRKSSTVDYPLPFAYYFCQVPNDNRTLTNCVGYNSGYAYVNFAEYHTYQYIGSGSNNNQFLFTSAYNSIDDELIPHSSCDFPFNNISIISNFNFYQYNQDGTNKLVSGKKDYDYTITSKVLNDGGIVDPIGVVGYDEGTDGTFKIIPEKGYKISELLIDGKSTKWDTKEKDGKKEYSYTFKGINSNHTLEVSFKEDTKSLLDSIIDGIAGLPGAIIDGISSLIDMIISAISGIAQAIYDVCIRPLLDFLSDLFIPSEDFMNEFIDNLKTFLEEKLGILYLPFYLIEEFVDFFISLVSNTNTITIPKLVEPFSGKTIYKGTTFNLQEIFNKGSIGQLYQIYFYFTDFIFISLLVIQLRKTWSSFFSKKEGTA